MSFKRFEPKDLIYSTLVSNPEYNFIVHSGSTYKDSEILLDGNFSNKIKHIANGEISLYELNINRPSDSKIYGFIEKSSSRYAHRTISTSQFDDASEFQYGSQITQSYPIKSSIKRIFVPDGQELNDQNFGNIGSETTAASNKKYIRALQTVINTQDSFGQKHDYEDLGTKKVNMLCVPGIFYGSKIEKNSVELNYYITGSLVSQVKDREGILFESYGPQSGSAAGMIIYDQGLLLLTGSWDVSSGAHTDKFFSSAQSAPSWLSFGTGLPFTGTSLAHSSALSSSYEIKFKGVNKIPTLTMMAYVEKGQCGFSTNPSFLEFSTSTATSGSSFYIEPSRKIKNITKSDFANHSASFESTTFISKVGIYDEDKNLIAIATLANPLKNTPSRDYMIKMRIDF